MKGNVLVIGNSGVGKSTLINAVLGKDVAKTSWGDKGTQMQLDISYYISVDVMKHLHLFFIIRE